jgi:hypothetical protein
MNYNATPEQWARIEDWAKIGAEYSSCLLELRAKVEALEANSKPTSNPSQIRSSLVERVAYAITGDSDGPINWKPEARAAIREVAAWLREAHSWTVGPAVLEQEAER